MQISKNLLGLVVGGLAILSGLLIHQGCPTRQMESQHGFAQCGRMGYYNVYPFAPNATALEELGNKTLHGWNTNTEALNAGFAKRFPQGIAHFTEGLSTDSCLSDGEARSFYKTVTSRVASWLGTFTATDSVEKAHTASKLRSDARKLTRTKMCDQTEAHVLKKRDRSEYGTEQPTFAYMVGKYAQQAVAKCKNTVCDIRNATCSAIISGAEKTNKIYNWIAIFF
jgi:hypothetical protein